jgi:hypothetical protein
MKAEQEAQMMEEKTQEAQAEAARLRAEIEKVKKAAQEARMKAEKAQKEAQAEVDRLEAELEEVE